MDNEEISGRGPKISPKVRVIIAEEYLHNPKRPAKVVMLEVHRKLHELKWQARPGWPGLSAVQKELAKINKKLKGNMPDEEDNLWHLSALAKVDIPAEALPEIMRAWAKAVKDDERFTIRQAKWIGRLYYAFRNVADSDQIVRQAYAMAWKEKAMRVLENPLDIEKDKWVFWQQDAYIYKLMTSDAEIIELITDRSKIN